jgi:hypothetical protein
VRPYSSKIALLQNSRGVYNLDPSAGCSSGTRENKRGCYADCYSARIARMYGYDFTQTVLRDFESIEHMNEIIRKINKIDLPFIRMGNLGDPSEFWGHTLKICSDIQRGLKEIQLSLFQEVRQKLIVILTRHFKTIPDKNLADLQRFNICINTSVSAIDTDPERNVNEYNRIKPYCNSILRVVTFDFNTDIQAGREYKEIQDWLLSHDNVIDTVFRPFPGNPLVGGGIIKTAKKKFLGKETVASMHNNKVFMGRCQACKEKCGVGVLK